MARRASRTKSFQATVAQAAWIEWYAEHYGVTQADVVRSCIAAAMKLDDDLENVDPWQP